MHFIIPALFNISKQHFLLNNYSIYKEISKEDAYVFKNECNDFMYNYTEDITNTLKQHEIDSYTPVWTTLHWLSRKFLWTNKTYRLSNTMNEINIRCMQISAIDLILSDIYHLI